MGTIAAEHFTGALLALLDETFDHVQGHYLDGGTSLFETLATISAAEASIPVGGQCATLAAQVKHVAFYMQVVDQSVRSREPLRVDWGEIWRTVSAITPDEWAGFQADLRASYNLILDLAKTSTWATQDELAGAIAIVAHCAYHLGEIRQALCTLRP
jgi:hypothetical protein